VPDQNLRLFDESGDRLAERVARRIENEIAAAGWPVGTLLGAEAQLQERYAVGRAVLREAVRLLEARGVARFRSGRGGGLVVTAPEREPVLHATSLFLDHRGVRPEHLYAAWIALECAAVEALARSIDEAGVARLRQVLLLEEQLGPLEAGVRSNVHVEIAQLSGNPALELFLGVVQELSFRHGRSEVSEGEARWLHERHGEIVDAVVAGDAALAAGRVRRYVERLAAAGAIDERPTTPAKPRSAAR
jgi:DNA-binding FadR family transcriptional regulator